jgi:hypothetical protein
VPFNDAITATIAVARPHDLENLARELWRAHGAGILGDDDAQRAAEAIHARRALERVGAGPGRQNAPRAAARRPQRPPERQASIERRRRLSASGPMPPAMAARFTTAELAVLRIVGDECRDRGCCALHLEAIAARAGTCRTMVQNALRIARRLGLVDVRERRRRGQRSLTNIVRIVSAEWLTWLRRGGGFKKTNTTDTSAERGLSERGEPTGFGARWQRQWKPYDPGDTSGDGRWRRRPK